MWRMPTVVMLGDRRRQVWICSVIRLARLIRVLVFRNVGPLRELCATA